MTKLGRRFRSIAAIVAGMLAIVILSLSTDSALSAARIYPSLGKPMSDPLLGLATIYRTAYAVAGSYIAARLAPNRPMAQALYPRCARANREHRGAAAMRNADSVIGHRWYPVALVVLALPPAWAGGRLREKQLSPR